MSHAQERILKADLNEIRLDHLSRYRWAADRLSGKRVIDAACGCGYGSAVLADVGCDVTAIDISELAISYAKKHWSRADIDWQVCDLHTPALPKADAVVSFETIEHLKRPKLFLRAALHAAPRLLASVPNEAVFPHDPRKQPFHCRHYTRAQFIKRLAECGWRVTAWFGQADKISPVVPELEGRTLIVDAVRA